MNTKEVRFLAISAPLFFSAIVCMALASSRCYAQNSNPSEAYSGFFRYEKGIRVDYEKNKANGDFKEDTITKTAVLHILIAPNQNEAQISLSYGKGANGREDNTWKGLVLRRSPDMIAILCAFGDDTEKFENYVIYPKEGVGFSITYSSFFGVNLFQRDLHPNLPFGSASIIQLKKLEQ